MKKKKISVIATSVASIAVCASIITGSTYALFTSETKTDIAITSAKVDVTATMGEVTATGLNGTAMVDAKVVGNSVELNNIAPGDKVNFNITVENKSTIQVQYRTKIACVEGEALMSALVFTVGEEDLSGLISYVSAWQTWDKAGSYIIPVQIELPEEVTGYQGLSCKVSYAVEAVQGNASTSDDDAHKDIIGVYYASTTAEAQALLDNAVDGDKIILKAGNYDTLYFNQSKLSGQYDRSTTPYGHYWLYRSFNNITISGEEGAVVDGIKLGGSLYNNNPNNKTFINPVTDDYTCFYATYFLKDITIRDLTFKKGIDMDALDMANEMYRSTFEGLTIENCKTVENGYALTNNSQFNKLADVRLVKDIVVKNCEINNRYQGVYLQAAENVTIENCNFDTLNHNAIQITAGSSGNIVIKNNTVKNDADRAIRFDVFNEGSISITGNVFTGSGDDDGQLCKINTLASGVDVLFAGNAWDGREFNVAVIGFGNSSEATLITNAEELYAFAENASKYAGKTVVLGADIDLAGKAWTPVNNFAGTFNGNNYAISNVEIASGNYTAAGLFGGLVTKSTVKNLTINNFKALNLTVTNGVGALAGTVQTGSVVDNVKVNNVTISANHYVGGLIGFSYAKKVSNCVVDTADLTAVPELVGSEYDNGDKVGGITGFTATDSTAPNDSYLESNEVYNVTIKGYRDLGGITGYGWAERITDSTVKNVTIVQDLTVNYKNYTAESAKAYVGGIAGRYSYGTINETNVATNVTISQTREIEVNPQDDLNVVLANLQEGDTLVLSEGTYSATALEQLKITANNVTIKGVGAATVIDCGGYSVSGQAGIYVSGDNVTISDLTIKSSAGGNISALKVSAYNEATENVKNVVIENVTIESEGHGLNLHGVDGAKVNNVTVTNCGKCGFSVARATDVVFTNCTVEKYGWADIGMMYSASGSYETPSSITIGEGNNFKFIYSERPSSANGGADTIVYDESVWTMTTAENGTWGLAKN